MMQQHFLQQRNFSPELIEMWQICNVPPASGDSVSYVGFNEANESLIYTNLTLKLNTTVLTTLQQIPVHMSKSSHNTWRQSEVLSTLQLRLRPRVASCSAVNVSRWVIEPCCIPSKGWPWGEAQKDTTIPVWVLQGCCQYKIEELKALSEIVISRTTTGCFKLVSGFSLNLCTAGHQLTSIQIKLLNWQGRFLCIPGGRGFLVYLHKNILSAGQGLNVCI